MRPGISEIAEARERCRSALRNGSPLVPEDVRVLVRATEPWTVREIDALVDRLGLAQYDVERTIEAILGRPTFAEPHDDAATAADREQKP